MEGFPGSTLTAEIEVKNNTHHPWKQGVFLGMDSSSDLVGLPIEVVNMLIPNEVKPFETVKLSIPLQICSNVVHSNEAHEVKLRFRCPRGCEIGETIVLKIKVMKKVVSQVEKVKLAIKLFDVLKLGQSYDACL